MPASQLILGRSQAIRWLQVLCFAMVPHVSSQTTTMTVTLDAASSTLQVTASGRSSISSTDWVAVYPAATAAAWSGSYPGSASLGYRYLPTSDPASTSLDISAFQNGEYAALLLASDGYTLIAQAPFTVTVTRANVQSFTAVLNAAATELTVTITGRRMIHPQDWLGIYLTDFTWNGNGAARPSYPNGETILSFYFTYLQRISPLTTTIPLRALYGASSGALGYRADGMVSLTNGVTYQVVMCAGVGTEAGWNRIANQSFDFSTAAPSPPSPPSRPPPLPPPPEIELAIGQHDSLEGALAQAAGKPLSLLVTGSHSLPALFASNSSASAVRLVGVAGATLSVDTAILAGGPAVHLSFFSLRGRLSVLGGELRLAGCTFACDDPTACGTVAGGGNGGGVTGGDTGGGGTGGGGVGGGGTGTGGGPGGGRRLNGGESSALIVSGGQLTILDTHLERLHNPISVTGGALTMSGSTLAHCEGSISVSGGTAHIDSTSIVGDVGTALHVSGGDVVLSNETLLMGNNRTIVLQSGSVRYALPAPLGRWCFIADGTGVSTFLPGEVSGDYPFACAAGRVAAYGAQSNPGCARPCPAGYSCGTATVMPTPCANGTYCPPSSPAPLDCPAGTMGGRPMLTSEAECEVCAAGTMCPRGSSEATECAPGLFAPDAGSATCLRCSPGKYQDETGATACKRCTAGHFCPGRINPVPCFAGTWSNTTGLRGASECAECTTGFFCVEGARRRAPCPAGTHSTARRLGDADGCMPCEDSSWSAPGSTVCTSCLPGFFKLPESDSVDYTYNAGFSYNTCVACPASATCAVGATLESLDLRAGHWRFGSRSQDIRTCDRVGNESNGGWSPCRGGDDAGELGDGHCMPGHQGPLCQVCSNSSHYYRGDQAMCVECLSTSDVILNMLLFIGVLALVLAFWCLLRLTSCYRWILRLSARLSSKVQAMSLMPKFKVMSREGTGLVHVAVLTADSLILAAHSSCLHFISRSQCCPPCTMFASRRNTMSGTRSLRSPSPWAGKLSSSSTEGVHHALLAQAELHERV